MNISQNKIIGWILLALGIGIIFWGIFSAYNIFTGKEKAPEIFALPVVTEKSQDPESAKIGDAKVEKIDPSKLQNISPADLQKIQDQQQAQAQAMLGKGITDQFAKMIPSDMITKMMNLSSWSIFVFILIYAGSKISGLGIKLMKD